MLASYAGGVFTTAASRLQSSSSAAAASSLQQQKQQQDEDDLLPPLATDEFREFTTGLSGTGDDAADFNPADAVDAPELEAVGHCVDELLDDLLAVRTDALKAFARTKQVKAMNKSALVAAILEVAKQEGQRPSPMRLTKRVLGESVAGKLESGGGIRAGWNNSSLEAAMLEHACQRLVKGNRTNFAETVRSCSKRSSWVSQRLLRMYQDEFNGTASAAVAGIFRNYRHEAEKLVEARKPNVVISAFASFLMARVSNAETPNLVSVSDIGSKMIDQGIVRASVQEEGLSLLESMMQLLDDVAAEVEARNTIYFNASSMMHGKERPETLRVHIATVRKRHANWDIDGAPQWAVTLVRQFSKWEALVRNDLPAFQNVPPPVFDAILLNVAAVKALQLLHDESETSPGKDVPGGYRTLLTHELMAHFGTDEAVHDAVLKLNHYVRLDRAERARVSAEMFEAILVQMEAMLPDLTSRPSSQRLALVLSEMSLTASRSEHLAGLYRLLVNLTEDMLFHLRFAPVYDRLSSNERRRLRMQNVNMAKTLVFFEEQFKGTVQPPSSKSIAFLVIILVYFSLRPAGSVAPVLQRLSSTTGRDDLSILTFTDRDRDRLRELKVAFPPQLSHESWLQSDQGKGGSLYKVVPAHAVKSSTSSIMLVSQAPIIRALDCISRVPWRVNKYMLHVQEAMVQEGYGFGKIRPAFYPLSYCRMRDGHLDTIANDGFGGDGGTNQLHNEGDARAYQEQLERDWRDLQDVRSSRVHYLQALRQARALVNEPAVYFPNNMDFRGRMYPLPGRLNHTGSDPFRALLEHAEPRPLGKEGLYWLKVHVANKIGQTKLSFDDRVRYVEHNINDIFRSAEAPLKGDRWWQEAEEPMQALMSFRELFDAYQCSTGPENYLSRLPVAVDGSYNGLQHYSAIGRDEHGGKLVNLLPSPKPADAYTGILKEMMKSILKDAENDVEVAIRCIGSGKGQDKNHIRRKTIKRPIMTQVYGVTAYGMGKQIEEELINQNKQHGLWLPAEMREMSKYIRDKIMESLGVTFSQTQKCREWLSEVSTLIWACQPRDLKSAFMWTTPLGLIVRQPYRESSETHLFTPIGYTRISGAMLEPASAKQLSALAPNLIHSLDATHLAMTALEMHRRGHSMMAVHDSYWTHACDLPHLSRILREQFVDLYTHYDPLREIKSQWEEQYFLDLRRHGVRLPDPPERGTLDLPQVLNSDYFFS